MDTYNIGRVFSRTVDQVRDNFWTLLAFVVLAYFLSGFVMLFAMIPLFASIGVNASHFVGQSPDAAMSALVTTPSFWLSILVAFLVVMLAYSAMYAGCFFGLAGGTNGNRATLGECFQIGFKKAVPLFLLQLMIGLGVLAGYVLLFVPGVILALMWSAAAPACVLEDLSATDSLSRSQTLTKGSKLYIFLTYLVVMVMVFVLEFVIILVFGLFFGVMIGFNPHPDPSAVGVGAVVGILLFELLAMVLGLFIILLALSLHVSIYREVLLVSGGTTERQPEHSGAFQ